LKISPTKGIRRFRVQGKLSPRNIRPYEIIEKLNLVAYWLDLHVDLEHVHNLFHVSQLRRYILDPNPTIKTEAITKTEDLTHEEHPVQILEHKIKQVHNKWIPLVKVLRTNHTALEAMLETKEGMKTKYPHLFEVILHHMKALSFENETF